MAEGKWTLAIDGSQRSDPLVILIDQEARVVWSAPPDLADPQLITAVRQALEIHRERIGAVVATCGPGSYMGVRGGLAAASGASQALRCPLALVGSLEVVASQVDPGGDTLLALADAGRGGTYGQVLAPAPPDTGLHRAESRGSAGLLGRGEPWPDSWSQASRAVGGLGEGRELPANVDFATAVRHRREALAWIASASPAPISGYDRIRAEYAVPVGARPWS
ncbi:MAG: hypothetical protein WBA31_03510 [Candidatus Dormiibacterota bacterium]